MRQQETICFSDIGNNHIRLIKHENNTYTVIHTQKSKVVVDAEYLRREEAVTAYNSLFESVKDMVDRYGNGVIFFQKD